MAHNAQVTTQRPDVLVDYRAAWRAAHSSPAAWLFLLLYVVSAGYILASGQFTYIIQGISSLIELVFFLCVVFPLTVGHPAPTWEASPPATSRRKLWWQIGLFLVYYLLFQYLLILLFRTPSNIFRWSIALLEWLVPLGIALLLGARWRELGFGRGYHTGRVLLAVFVIPFIAFIAIVITLKLHLYLLIVLPLNLFFSAALPEEIAYRGVLMTRLTRALGPQWGIVLSALLFGLMHTPLNLLTVTHGSIPMTLALDIAADALFGLTMALFLRRTGNLLAGILFHTVFDCIGNLF